MLHTVMEAAADRISTEADHHRHSAAGAVTLAAATPAGAPDLRALADGVVAAEAVAGAAVEEVSGEEAADGARSPSIDVRKHDEPYSLED
jgi:hypothetical protein